MTRWGLRAAMLFCAALLQTTAVAQLKSVKKYTDLTFPPLPDLKTPEPERFVLPNGMVVFLLEDHELPTVMAAARIRTGSRLEPADRAGLATITGRVMRSGGTEAFPGDDLDTMLDGIGAKVEVEIGVGSGLGFVYALKEDAPKVVHILADVLQHPLFPKNKFDSAKTEMANGLLRRTDTADGIAQREVARLLYGAGTPYTRFASVASIRTIQREDAVAFHERYFHPENIVLGIWGDLTKAQMRALIEREFGSWQRSTQSPPEIPTVSRSAEARRTVHLVNTPSATNTVVTLAGLGGKRSDPDHYAAIVLARLMSGSLSSAIRGKGGLAYLVTALWAAQFDYPGVCMVRSDTKNTDTVKVVNMIDEQLHKFMEGEVSEADLQLAKDALLKSSAFDYDTIDKIVTRFVDYEYFGYPRDYARNFRSNINKITKADLVRVAKQYWDPAKMALVVVGEVAGLEKQLSNLGPVNVSDGR